MARTKARTGLPFEQPILKALEDLERLRDAHAEGDADLSDEVRAAETRVQSLTREIFGRLSPWERVQLARHVDRPQVADYVESVFTDVVELHGDRGCGDDRAILTALARIGPHRVLLVGHRKGRNIDERKECNFGMPQPEGYRKAILKMRMAERFGLPVLCLVDTPGAYPGKGAEERGQSEAIARSTEKCLDLRVPLISVVIGEGGSGGAVAFATANRVAMLEHSIYSVISPEGCASILWKDAGKANDAAEALRLTAQNLNELGVCDRIIPEPKGGAHRDPRATIEAVRAALIGMVDDMAKLSGKQARADRRKKYLNLGSKGLAA